MSQKSVSVLLFEDDESQALLTREALEEQGMHVDVASKAHDGLKLAMTHAYDVFLIDMKLPDIPGVEVLRRLNSVRPGALSIVVTGHGDETMAVEAMKLGAYDYVVKSPNLGHLAALPMLVQEGVKRNRLKDEREALRSEIWEYSRLLAERNAELRRARKELKRFDALRADLISMLAHDLRNPLTTIKEFAGILQQELAGPVSESQNNYLNIIQSNSTRLADMIKELLFLTRIEGGYVPLQKRFISASELLLPIIDSMRPLAGAKKIDLVLSLPEEEASLFSDPLKMADVFNNLIDNAIKYSDRPGRIMVSLKEEERSYLFSFEDSGRGMSVETAEKIFRPRGHEHTSAEDAKSSLSISLALSQRIVELHGGRIWVETKGDQGSIFYVVLPKFTKEEMFQELVRSAVEQAKLSDGMCSLIAFSVANTQSYLQSQQTELLKDVLIALRGKLELANYQRSGDLVLYWEEGHMVVIIAGEGHEGAARIAERLNGVLHSESLEVGGETVQCAYVSTTVSFPSEAHSTASLLALLQKKFGQPWDQRRRKILVLGDNTDVAESLKQKLEGQPCEIIHRFHISESMSQFDEDVIDLIIIDTTLSDGFKDSLLQAFKQHSATRDIPVLYQVETSEDGEIKSLAEAVLKKLQFCS